MTSIQSKQAFIHNGSYGALYLILSFQYQLYFVCLPTTTTNNSKKSMAELELEEQFFLSSIIISDRDYSQSFLIP